MFSFFCLDICERSEQGLLLFETYPNGGSLKVILTPTKQNPNNLSPRPNNNKTRLRKQTVDEILKGRGDPWVPLLSIFIS
jgi:hypothetical protein